MKLYYHPASTTSRIVELFARDQGIDGAAASAEEAAVHIVRDRD